MLLGEVKHYLFKCDGCGVEAVGYGVCSPPLPLPEGWAYDSEPMRYPYLGSPKHYCEKCSTIKEVIE